MELIAIDRGLGRHFFYLDAWQREQQSMYNTISQAFCILSLCFCKISICLSLLRIIQSTRQNLTRWVLYTIMVLVLIINVIVVITLFEQCRPTAKVWNRPLPGVCWKFPKILYVAIMQGGVLSGSVGVICVVLLLRKRSFFRIYRLFAFCSSGLDLPAPAYG